MPEKKQLEEGTIYFDSLIELIHEWKGMAESMMLSVQLRLLLSQSARKQKNESTGIL